MNKEEQGLTIGEYFKVIFKRVWWVVGATLVGLAAFMLIFGLWYNREMRTYSLTYQLTYPNSESGYYPDGTVFIIEDSVSKEALLAVRNGTYSGDAERFSDIDVEDMVDDDKIALTKETDEITGATTYTVTANASYFKNKSQALAFLREVAMYPVDRINEIAKAIVYDKYLTDDVYGNAKTYADRIELLETQKDYIETMYGLISGESGDVAFNLAKLQIVFTSTDIESLESAISNNYYRLDYETYIENVDDEIGALKIEIDGLKAEIEMQTEARDKAASTSPGATLDAYDQRISELTSLIAESEKAISTIYKTLNKMGNSVDESTDLSAITLTVSDEYKQLIENFNARLETYRTQLNEQSKTLKNTYIKVYAANSKVTYSNNKLIVDDEISLALAALMGAVLGFVASAVVVCIIDGPKYKRKKYGLPKPVKGAKKALPEGESDEGESDKQQ